MPIETRCPGCRARYTLPEGLEGKRVRCKQCEESFLVRAAGAARAAEADDEDEREDRYTEGRRSRPAARRAGARGLYDEDEDDEGRPLPRRRGQRGNDALPWIIGGAAAAVVILIGGTVGVALLLRSKPASPTVAQAPAPAVQFPAPAVQQPQPFPQNPGIIPVPAPVPPVFAPANQPASIVLSNGRVGRFGARRTFSIDYRFDRGSPAVGQWYFVVINSPSGSGEASFSSLRLGASGTFELKEFGFGVRNDVGPYDVHVEVSPMPGRFGQRTTISNTLRIQ